MTNTERLGATGIHRDVQGLLGGVDFIGEIAEIEIYYNVIFGLDWWSQHRVVLDCLRARVHIPRADGRITFQGIQAHRGFYIISMLYVEELLERESEGFLVTISMVKDDGQYELQDTPVVAKFEDVFKVFKGPPPA